MIGVETELRIQGYGSGSRQGESRQVDRGRCPLSTCLLVSCFLISPPYSSSARAMAAARRTLFSSSARLARSETSPVYSAM